MNGKVKILFFCTVFVAGRAFGQNTTHLKPVNEGLKFYKLSILKPAKKQNLALVNTQNEKTANTFRLLKTNTSPQVIPANYYTSNFGFFCKKELQLEKLTSIPFKFRLGSVQQCDRLEGKNIAITQ